MPDGYHLWPAAYDVRSGMDKLGRELSFVNDVGIESQGGAKCTVIEIIDVKPRLVVRDDYFRPVLGDGRSSSG